MSPNGKDRPQYMRSHGAVIYVKGLAFLAAFSGMVGLGTQSAWALSQRI
jgi:hypothetical protein